MLLPCGGEFCMLLPCGGEFGMLLAGGGPAGFLLGVAALLRLSGGGGLFVLSDSCPAAAVEGAPLVWEPSGARASEGIGGAAGGALYDGSGYFPRWSSAQFCTNARFCATLVGTGASIAAASSLTSGPRSDDESEPSKDARRILE